MLADLFTRPYPRAVQVSEQGLESRAGARGETAASRSRQPATTVATAVVLVATLAGMSGADDPAEAVRQGLSWYGKGDFEKARDRFAAAREQFDTGDAAKAAIAAFDQACASHRKGDVSQAREWYLKAGLAHDKALAASAHFNLGTLSAEEANRLAGEHPEDVAPEKRPEILDQLKAAVASFRHCLELQPENVNARRDIELLRQWIKYYSDQWQQHDREKRRQETNLVAFLEFLIETQRALRESVKALTATAPADAYAEPKRLQDELQEEIGPLKEKIKTELTPKPSPGAAAPQGQSGELEKGIALLQGWADAAGEKMASAARHLDGRQSGPAATDQQSAIDELEKIWDAVIPFRALLARDLADQTMIAQSLAPAPPTDLKSESGKKADDEKASQSAGTGPASLGSESEDLAPLAELQERTQRRTQLLKLKAEAELARMENSPPPEAAEKKPEPSSGKDEPKDAQSAKPKPVDPKLVKAGYQKAIELSPRAVEQMDRAAKSLKQKDRPNAYPPAEAARKILEDIQKAQPKEDQQDQKKQEQDKKNEDQQKKDQEQKDQPKKDDQQKKDQQKKDQQKKDQEEKKPDEPKKEQEQKKPGESKKSDEQKKEQQQPEPQVSRDRIEEALRKVRERQQEKRERDRKMKVRVLGRVPVEKDW